MRTAKPKPQRGAGRSKSLSAVAAKSAGARTRLGAEPASASFALVDRAYDGIREAIREGSLTPGQRLVERDLAVQLGVSRTPVREALRLLEAHGLASTLAGRGLIVTSLAADEVFELYYAWENLEGLAARTAAQHATALEIDALRQIHALWDAAGTPRTLGRLNKRFHAALHVATHNRFLARALRTIDDSVTLLGLTTYTIPGRGREVATEHGDIVEAIARRDATAAEEAARRHIRRAGQLRMALTGDLDESGQSAFAERSGSGRSIRRM